jgi:hypothetical protein
MLQFGSLSQGGNARLTHEPPAWVSIPGRHREAVTRKLVARIVLSAGRTLWRWPRRLRA